MCFLQFKFASTIKPKKINEWLQINRFSLNIAKSKFMIFQKDDKEMEVLTLKVDNMNIERVK